MNEFRSVFHVGRWAACLLDDHTRPCGVGSTVRNVYCLNALDEILPDGNCTAEIGAKPRQENKCRVPCPQECEVSPWGTWSECSASCGPQGGVQSRSRQILCEWKSHDPRLNLGVDWDWEALPPSEVSLTILVFLALHACCSCHALQGLKSFVTDVVLTQVNRSCLLCSQLKSIQGRPCLPDKDLRETQICNRKLCQMSLWQASAWSPCLRLDNATKDCGAGHRHPAQNSALWARPRCGALWC